MSEGPIAAPELDGATAWLNVAEPIRMAQLRGKVVLVDFWTYGCINCLHVLQDLKVLEERFPDELVVIGVHSPKFPNEKITENLKRILVRYEIEHPVANDADHQIWRRYGVQAWPTRVIVDPMGNLVGTAMGEGNLQGFVDAIRGVIRVFDPSTPPSADVPPTASLRASRVMINRSPLRLQLERDRHADQPLLYPGKMLADENSGRLFIADSNHNRVVVADLPSMASGVSRVLDVVGSGLQGDADGIFTQARFRGPQGLAFDGTSLYVADQGNNQLRVVDFEVRAVHTLDVGRLSSPWDLALRTGILIVAMAGPHQIWVVDLLHDRAYPYAGSGEEARRDGMVSAAAFAQPSGLAVDGDMLYVADAESNAIRAVTLPPVNDVRTIAGGDLFDFGDRDGHGDTARFQHPLGVAAYGGRVFVADTYNHKIKVIDPGSGAVSTFAGGKGEFHEPGGISIAAGRIFVADTNNHRIRTIDLATRQVATLTMEGLAPPAAWSYLRRA